MHFHTDVIKESNNVDTEDNVQKEDAPQKETQLK